MKVFKNTILFIVIIFLCCLSFACSLSQETFIATSSAQTTSTPQNKSETAQNLEPTPTPLTEKDLKRRAEIHKQILNGENLHDGALHLQSIGDISSVPALLVVLKKNPPLPSGSIICTAAHALIALRKITGANPGTKYEDWNAWWEKYQEEHKLGKQ